MIKKISSALISVYNKDGLEPLIKELKELEVTIYSTGGTQSYIESLGAKVIAVEQLTGYPSILGGRVKTLHPIVFGGILGRSNESKDLKEMEEYDIPGIDLVIVDLYPFQETVAEHQLSFNTEAESVIIEKIDIGGVALLRAAAKNYADVAVIASKEDYLFLISLLQQQSGEVTLEQRKKLAAKAFKIVAEYDLEIAKYFNPDDILNQTFSSEKTVLRYGENPHQQAVFFGDIHSYFSQLHGKEISYNNLVDIDAAIELMRDFNQNDSSVPDKESANQQEVIFAIIKHTNVCGIAARTNLVETWKAALEGDQESAFGGVLICNREIDVKTAELINEIFFEVLMAPSFTEEALSILKSKKNRILLQLNFKSINSNNSEHSLKSVVNGVIKQEKDNTNYESWLEVGGRVSNSQEKEDLIFANLVCKHLKSNAIALVKNKQLIGKGCGQTSRIDALRQAIEKAKQFNFNLSEAVLASDAFFPFNDSVQLAHSAGITAIIQPGGSVRDNDSIEYCKENNLCMVMTKTRHFRH